MAGEHRERNPGGQLASDEPPTLVDDVHFVDGEEGRRLAHAQARALWEVTQWLVQNSYRTGREPTA
ncbi:hypothetical protein [Haloechinothrix salitolerans]|uniref:Uncharacterized protein n=1 Tax=Haloechinothrix salitolerans TaxID=926830 RepID=A0ABW2C510_9PSEU